MKRRYLQGFDNYEKKEDAVNENFTTLSSFNNFKITEEEEDSKKEDSKKKEDNEKEVDEECESTKEMEENEEENGEENSEENKDKKETEENEDETSEAEAETEVKADNVDGDVDASDAVDENGDGLQDITNSFDPLSTSPREFSVVKIMTNNGAKVMMCYTCDADEYDSLADNLDFKSACSTVETECSKNGLEKFDKNTDTSLGGIPSFMMDKMPTDAEGSTSYRP